MKFKATLASLAAASFVIAQPAAAAADRLGAPVEDAEGAAVGGFIWVVVAFAALLAVGELTEVINVFGDDEPASP